MPLTLQAAVFGAFSGWLWALILIGSLGIVNQGTLPYLCGGVLTGIVVSLLLKPAVARSSLWTTAILGVVALPLGAFVFGLIYAAIDRAMLPCTDNLLMGMINTGFLCAVMSIIAFPFLFPVSILTTFLLRRVVHGGQRECQ